MITALSLGITLVSVKGQSLQDAQSSSGWPAYGGDAGGRRYSALQQINSKNVKQLKVAWTYQTGELIKYNGTNAKEKAAFEATPILADHTLYFSTPSCQVFAIDASSGAQKWIFDPKVNLKNGFSEITSRGVSAWPAPGDTANSSKAKKIFVATLDGRLIALDAGTGEPIVYFGKDGTVDLRAGFGKDLSITSPPAIIGNLVIVGSSGR